MTYQERQRRRRAAGQVGTAALVDKAVAHSATLGEFCEWLLEQPREEGQAVIDTLSDIRAAIVAVKILRHRRELRALGWAMESDPAAVADLRGRYAEVLPRVRELERSAGAGGRPWAAVLEREETAPARRAT